MKYQRKLPLSFFVAAILAVGVVGQAEVLTNAEVLKLLDAGVTPQLILRKITNSTSRFDVSTASIIDLTKRRVPEEVILAMIDRQTEHAGFSDSTAANTPNTGAPDTLTGDPPVPANKREMLASARTIAFVKSSAHPSRQALEKELMKRQDFLATRLTITRYKDKADLYVEIGYVSLSWLTHRYVYRIYDRNSGTVLAAGETTSWGSLAANLARNIAKSLVQVG